MIRVAAVVLIISCTAPPADPAKPLDTIERHDVDALGPELAGRRVQVRGEVRSSSAERLPGGDLRWRFELGRSRLVVEYEGVVPDQFRESVIVVTTGVLSEDGKRFVAEELRVEPML